MASNSHQHQSSSWTNAHTGICKICQHANTQCSYSEACARTNRNTNTQECKFTQTHTRCYHCSQNLYGCIHLRSYCSSLSSLLIYSLFLSSLYQFFVIFLFSLLFLVLVSLPLSASFYLPLSFLPFTLSQTHIRTHIPSHR